MSENDWIAALPADRVADDEPAVAVVRGEEIALYKVGSEYFATSNICTHAYARLSEGFLDGHTIECPLHQGLFDIRDGRCTGGPVDVNLASYEVRVRDGQVEIRARAASADAA